MSGEDGRPVTAPYALFVVRVVAGLLFWQHGLEKLFGFAGARPETALLGIRGLGGCDESIRMLLELYKTYPNRIIDLIYAKPAERLKAFSNAFKFRKDDT